MATDPCRPKEAVACRWANLWICAFRGSFLTKRSGEKIKGEGGMFAYLGTKDALEVENRIKNGDEYARQIYMAISYQVSKEICALSAVLKGKVDGILLTGGLAYSDLIVSDITERISHIAPVKIYRGEGEMKAMAMNAYMVYTDEIQLKDYQ
jgi:butyrate kinase